MIGRELEAHLLGALLPGLVAQVQPGLLGGDPLAGLVDVQPQVARLGGLLQAAGAETLRALGLAHDAAGIAFAQLGAGHVQLRAGGQRLPAARLDDGLGMRQVSRPAGRGQLGVDLPV